MLLKCAQTDAVVSHMFKCEGEHLENQDCTCKVRLTLSSKWK